MRICDLAQGLGISRQMVGKLKKQGMPLSSLAEAIAWRKANIDPFRSKKSRIGGGNTGLKRGALIKKENTTDDLITASIRETLTNIIPKLWFRQVGWLGGAMRDHGVKVSVEQLLKIQAILFLTYMSEADEFLKTENEFYYPEILRAKQDDKQHSEMIGRLTEILNQKPTKLYES